MNRNALTADLTRDEGLRLKPYRDKVGKLTIGVGRNLDDVGISADEAKAMLAADIETAIAELDRAIPWWRGLPEPAQRALVNMQFNLGWPRLSQFTKFLRALQAHEFEAAAIEAVDSKWSGQVGARAQRIADLIRSCAASSKPGAAP